MTAPTELQTGPMMENKFGKTGHIANITSKLKHLYSQATGFSLSRKGKSQTE